MAPKKLSTPNPAPAMNESSQTPTACSSGPIRPSAWPILSWASCQN